MCSQVKVKGQIKAIGDPVDVLTALGPISGTLGGCARSESYEAYWKDVLVRGELEADSYFEAGQEFILRPETRLLVGVCGCDSKYHIAGEVLIITREAQSELELRIHNRHPVIVEPTYGLVPA